MNSRHIQDRKLFIVKYIFITALLFSTTMYGQIDISKPVEAPATTTLIMATPDKHRHEKIVIDRNEKWKMTGNRYLTGGLMLLAGAAKGFNETLMFDWHGFASVFPKANPQWFWPTYSFKNKYKEGDPAKGAKFPLSTSVLVMFTDQYHLNNFIQKAAMTTAIVIKIGEKKKPFRHYVFDALYYTACYQLGFGSVYYTFKSRN